MIISFCIMPSIGSTSRVSISLEKSCMRMSKVMQVNRVFMMLKRLTLKLYWLWFRITFRVVRSMLLLDCLSVRSFRLASISLVLMVCVEDSRSSLLKTLRSTLSSSGNSLKGDVNWTM